MNEADLARRPRALVVEDEEHLARLVADHLARDQITAQILADGERALELARAVAPDVVLLDLMLPGIDGIEVCRRLRTFSDAYVIMLTARAEETDNLVGLAVGADDYMVKPFSPRELTARIRQVLAGLPANALRHTPPGGSVCAAAVALPGGTGVRITVSDTGDGIAPEHLPHVFERFYRAEAARDQARGGSGIGLTIARALITAHGGTLAAAGDGPGTGARFTITLPRRTR